MTNKGPALAVDCVVVASSGVVLIKRGHDPFKGCYALPGGFVEVGETVEEACKKETFEETGLVLTKLKLIGVYSEPSRDSRRHIVSVAFLGEADISTLCAGDDASHAEIVRDWRNNTLAFDHKKIISDAHKLNNG
ncbi:MAG: NUDIX hydrolase [Candidatus Liptonbacteria bacterium]|nr:NUDIX hydrolase [Candidatus Liptonbacteria bacterium]